ncbi:MULTISPECIES: sensor histidine kinase [unclassified Azospirillum]|uniref:sensor histidine kinase n=1 Tax=unclassified Azospirillum TaxID=2630922 RepID=UPI001178CC2A|nr:MULTISPECIES: HWE histidine kinase domain-containing protein [unclassified Azospirillum]
MPTQTAEEANPSSSPSPRILDTAPSRAVIWLAVSALLIAMALFGMELVVGRDRVMDRAAADARAGARQLAEHAAKVIGTHALILKNAEWVFQNDGWDKMAATPSLYDWLRHMATEAPEVQSYWLVDAKGEVRINTLRWPSQSLNVADRPYFSFHVDQQSGPYIGPRMIGRIHPEIFFPISQRIEGRDGSFQGVAQVSLRPGYFESFYASVALMPGTEVMLVLDDGTVLARHPATMAAELGLPMVATLLAQAGQAEASGAVGDRLFNVASPFDGVRRYYAVAGVDRLPVKVIYGLSQDHLDEVWLQSALGHIGFALVATMLLLPLAAIAMRQTKQAEQAQTDLRKANSALESRVAERTDHLHSALTDLRRSEERLSRLVATIPVGVVEYNASGIITDINVAGERIFGMSKEELAGLSHDAPLWQAALPDGKPLAGPDHPVARALAGETISEMEYTVRDPRTGARQVLSVNAAAIRDPGGQVIGCTATIVDVTARYEAEDRQRLLMREVDHRAKNALAVAQAVVRLSKGDSIAEFTRAVEGRISSLARSHSLLAQASWSGADLKRLLEDELNGFVEGPGRLVLSGPAVQLGADLVQSLGLTFHELATNAAKHGALSADDGYISVRWSVQRQVLNLHWEEHGGPKVTAPPDHKGFGSTLLGQVLRHQLGGKMEMEWAETGLKCHLTLPLTEA